MSLLKTWLLFFYRWRYKKFIQETAHAEVVAYVQSEGRMTSRYSFMITMACGISMLGLLQSSPAVVIGAMLISPLMGPIMNIGFSLATLDFKHLKKALEAIIIGILLALSISWLIVMLSPISDPTVEIMARTRPNLFDLLVAIFSGLAGCYATIHRKGGTIVGVAIATALMPPLAVVGFGLAKWDMNIAGGAFMLFMTNLLAISLSATAMAKLYGFGREHGGKHVLWQSAVILTVTTMLSLPLGHALKDIAYQTYATRTAKEVLRSHAGEESRLNSFSISFAEDANITIDVVILTSAYHANARYEAERLLTEKLSRPVQLRYDQIVLDREKIEEVKLAPITENSLASSVQEIKISNTDIISNAIRQAAFFSMHSIEIEEETQRIILHPKIERGLTLAALRQFEETLQHQYVDWQVTLIPPAQALPSLLFKKTRAELQDNSEVNLKNNIWALTRWGIKNVIVVGHASTAGEAKQFDNTSLALQRADRIARYLQEAGFLATSKVGYKSTRQVQEEKIEGQENFQRVEIRLLPQEPETELIPNKEPLSE